MKNFRKYNLITGWVLFIISSIVYLLTIEPTTSFWDTGEFITSSYKLEVGHPPGAPFFMILGRLFTLFAFNEQTISVTMNVMSALASSFTILFLFWTITHLARKIMIQEESDYNRNKILAMMFAGAVGALAYTFSDTFWFSAVEAEVYATSSLFTAFVFWAILKWENIADDPHANKWLILIAYLMGLSIGVHLLNLLAIPAIVFVIYFRKYKITAQGIIASLLISVLILGAMMYVVIPGIVAVGSWMELMFVNGFGMGYHSGLIIYVFLLFGLIAFGIYYTYKKRLVLWNTFVTIFAVIAIGYASYGVIIIRSNADTPLDESNPDSAFSLLRYLNREQYGQTPLFYGNYFNAPAIERIDGKPIYYKDDGKYVKVENPDYKYHPDFRGLFPRMWSDQDHHIDQYMYWANMNESELFEPVRDNDGNPVRAQDGSFQFDRSRPAEKPTFAQNLRFFFRYQVGYMYLRYFMWNFAGRQNDIQGHGELTHGNWISGIKFIDEARLGPQENMPDHLKENPGRNTYFFLPLILGIVGMFFHYKNENKDFWVVSLLFLFTGLAIVAYLNQYPVQPRERDYAYAGSFYAFTIWIGLGVLGLINYLTKNYKSVSAIFGVGVVSLVFVPGLLASQNWDDHDRSGRYTARDFAWNYLNTCEENAIIFTNGDNDTFPLWYLQEVEGVRTDVRVINLSYFTADWYIEQMATRMYESDPVKFGFNRQQYRNGSRDYVLFAQNTQTLVDEKYNSNRVFFENEYEELYNHFLDQAARSKLPAVAPKDYEELQKGYTEISPERFAGAVSRVGRRQAELGFNKEEVDDLIDDIESFIERVDESHMPLKDAMAFLRSDDPRFRDGRFFFPGNKFLIDIDKDEVLATGVLNEDQAERIVDQVRWELTGRRGITKNSLMIMDLLDQISQDGWNRPIYFAITASRDNFLDLEPYLHREGLGYRLLPATGAENDLFAGSVNAERMYDNVMNKFRWGNVEDSTVYLDENNLRMLTNFRYTFASLANALLEEGKKDSALNVLDQCMELMPNDRVPYNAAIMPLIQVYYNLDQIEKANAIVSEFADMVDQELLYYEDLMDSKPSKFQLSANDFQFAGRNLMSLYSISANFGQTELSDKVMEMIQRHNAGFSGMF
ncbi:MAG: protein O-mannosyl-transferase family [Bacteroidales bacterium]